MIVIQNLGSYDIGQETFFSTTLGQTLKNMLYHWFL